MRVELADGAASLELRMRSFAVLSERRRLQDFERREVVEALLGTLEQQRHVAVVLHLGPAHPLPAAQRAHVSEQLTRRWPALRCHWAALAVVVNGPVDVAHTSARFWLDVSPVPARIFGEHQALSALGWAFTEVQRRRAGAPRCASSA